MAIRVNSMFFNTITFHSYNAGILLIIPIPFPDPYMGNVPFSHSNTTLLFTTLLLFTAFVFAAHELTTERFFPCSLLWRVLRSVCKRFAVEVEMNVRYGGGG